MSKPRFSVPSAIGLGTATADSRNPGSAWSPARNRLANDVHCCGSSTVEAGQRDVGLDHVLDVEARADRHELRETAEQQPGGDEQHHRQGDFPGGKHGARAAAIAAFTGAAATLAEARLEISVCGEQCRRQPERACGSQREKQRETQDPAINGNRIHPGQSRRQQRSECLNTPVCERDADDAAEQAEDDCLTEQLTDNPGPPRPRAWFGPPSPERERLRG